MIPILTDPESLSTFGDLSTDEADSVFGLLADERRRAVLRYLDDRGSASLAEVAEHLALEGRTEETSASSGHAPLSDERRNRVETSLRHTHLPTLADAGVVDFDTETNAVSLREEGRTLLARVPAIEGEVG